MFRVSSTHLQEDIVVHKQHMVPSLSIRVLVSCWYAAIGRTVATIKVPTLVVTVLTELHIYPPSNKHIQLIPSSEAYGQNFRVHLTHYRAFQMFGCSYPSSAALPVLRSKLLLLLHRILLLLHR